TRSPSPWGRPWRDSYPLGDLAFHHQVTFRAWFRPPIHPLNRVHIPDRCTERSCQPRSAYGRHPMHAASSPTSRRDLLSSPPDLASSKSALALPPRAPGAVPSLAPPFPP